MDFSLKAYRRRGRIRRNQERLRQEMVRYESAFEAGGLEIPDDAAIRRLLRDRFPLLRPKPRGTLSIIAVYHHYNWEDTSLRPALERFGRVRCYDWFGAYDHGHPDWRVSVKKEMNRDLVKRIRSWVSEERPDVIFTYLSGELISPETARMLRDFGVPMIHFCLNDKENFVGKIRDGLAFGSRDICRYFDLAWTSTADALKKYCVEGAIPIYLPEGANPEIHRPLGIEKTIDVSFVGQNYGNRPQIIRRLGEAGINVETFGQGWQGGSLSTEEMVRVYSRSRINLGFGGVDGCQETYCLKGRDFEIPMSGGLYLTERHPELETVYDLGREIVAYQDFDDLVGKIRHLLDHTEEAESIRQAGFSRARRDHTWEMRFDKILTLMNLVQPQ